MSFAAHGNWCGPGWSAKQWKDAKDLTEEDKKVPAIDALDQACKNHDIGIAEGDPNANKRFFEEATAAGYYGMTLAQFVKIGGPPLQNYLRGGEEVNNIMSRRRESKKQRQEATYQRTLRNARVSTDGINTQDLIEAAIPAIESLKDVDPRNVPLPPDDDAMDQADVRATEDVEVMEALTDLNGDFVTPDRPMMREAPVVTREDNPVQVGRNVRDRANNIQPLSNLLDQVDNTMQDTNMEPMAPMAMTTRSAGNQSDGNVSTNKQVMPMYNTPRELGFWTETRTAVLPLSIYFSINKLDHKSPVVLRFVVNDTYNIFRDTSVQVQTFPAKETNGHLPQQGIANVPQASGTNAYTLTTNHQPAYYSIPVARSKGISTDLAYSVLGVKANGVKYHKPVGMNYSRAIQFPTTTRCSTPGTATTTNGGKFGYVRGDNSVAANGDYPMAWRPYYERVYRNRHVMQCDWKLTIENAVEGSFHRGVALETMECVTTQTVPTPTTPIDQPLSRMQRFKHIKKHQLACRNAQGGKVANIINGSWSPNANIRRDVVDEENTKTWYPTKNPNGPAPADWKEYAQYLFYNDEMSDNQSCYFNCRLDMSYTVQYRDLIDALRFPDASDATTILQIRDGYIPEGVYNEGDTSTEWPRNDEVTNFEESIEMAISHHFAP